MFRALIRFWFFLERVPPFLVAAFSAEGIFSHEGRILIWGKFRRFILTLFPPLAIYLQKRYGLVGGCINCGASCKLLFRCPHWDDQSRLCSVYEDRPSICKYFPITPADLKDRDIVLAKTPCGFGFSKAKFPISSPSLGVPNPAVLAAVPLNRPRHNSEE